MRISDWSADVCSSDLLPSARTIDSPVHARLTTPTEREVHRPSCTPDKRCGRRRVMSSRCARGTDEPTSLVKVERFEASWRGMRSVLGRPALEAWLVSSVVVTCELRPLNPEGGHAETYIDRKSKRLNS